MQCIACVKDENFQILCSAPFQNRALSLNDNRICLLDILLLLALYEIPFAEDSIVSGDTLLYDAVTEMEFYRRPMNANTFQVLLPKVSTLKATFLARYLLVLSSRNLYGLFPLYKGSCIERNHCYTTSFDAVFQDKGVWMELLSPLSSI